jgi:hypothetical protein
MSDAIPEAPFMHAKNTVHWPAILRMLAIAHTNAIAKNVVCHT